MLDSSEGCCFPIMPCCTDLMESISWDHQLLHFFFLKLGLHVWVIARTREDHMLQVQTESIHKQKKFRKSFLKKYFFLDKNPIEFTYFWSAHTCHTHPKHTHHIIIPDYLQAQTWHLSVLQAFVFHPDRRCSGLLTIRDSAAIRDGNIPGCTWKIKIVIS